MFPVIAKNCRLGVKCITDASKNWLTPFLVCHCSLEKMVADTPHVAQRLLEMALDELDAARGWMVLLGRKTAREKIATFLMMVVRRTSEDEGAKVALDKKITLPLTREAMAVYVGLTLESVSGQFSKLRKKGLIVMSGKRDITIPDVAKLLAEPGSDPV
jgi:CRP/FNR family transcriptional regulator